MPNHITNIITYNGDRKHIEKMLEAIKIDELGIGTVDFNKIIPMPDYVYKGNLGRKERELYGNKNWYDWSIANWGTKWNSYGYQEGFDYSQTDCLSFQTAWAAPHPVIQKLSEMFPDVEFTHEWADEDIGYNCGRHKYFGGECTEEFYPESEFEGIKFATRIMEIDPQDYGLYINATETAFINLPDEEFEIIELFNQKALFTNNRMTSAEIPLGLNCYHLRNSDIGDYFVSLEKNVAVNFGGTVITKEPIDFNNSRYIQLNDENAPNFLGETSQMDDFMTDNYMQEEIEMEVSPV